MKNVTQQLCLKIMKKTLLLGLCAIGTAGLTCVHAQSTNLIDVQILDASISIQYGGNPPNPLPVMSGAAVLGESNDVWNTIAASNLTYSSYPSGATIATPLPLNYANGTPSGISMTLSAPAGTYNANSFGNYSPFTRAGSPYSALMQTLMVVGAGQSGSVTLTGLTVGQGYKIIFYTAGDQNVSGGREGLYTVNGNGEYYIWDGVTTNLVSAVTYLEFDGVAPDSTGKLVINLGNPSAETDMNGFQMVPVPGGPSASSINNISPNGSQFFENTTNLTFSITSASTGGAPLPTNPTNSVAVVVNGQSETSLLKFTGTSTNWNVSLPGFTSNSVYTVGIVVTNSAGLFSSNSVTFDTYVPEIIVPVETYDFNGGQFIQSAVPASTPGPTTYFGVTGVSNVDYSTIAGGVSGGGATLVPNYPDRGDSNVAFQVASDRNLPLYLAQSNPAVYNVNLSYNNAGNWFNYTRSAWPTNYCIVYGRVSSGNGAPGGIGNYEALNLLTGGYGTSTQATNTIGYFIIKNGGNWNSYSWVPLTDANGNVLPIKLPGGQQTLQLLSGGGLNVIDFMFLSIPSLGLPPAIANFNPALTTGGNEFLSFPGTASFSVSSLVSTLSQSNIHTWVNGNLVSETFTGNNTNWTVTFPISGANQIQSFTISAVDNNGLSNSVAGTFNTFSTNNFRWMAADYDFSTNNGTGTGGSVGNGWTGGQFINSPVPTGDTGTPIDDETYQFTLNSYFGYPTGLYPGIDPSGFGAIAEQSIDINWPTNLNQDPGLVVSNSIYRLSSSQVSGDGVGTQVAGDSFLLPEFLAAQTKTLNGRDGTSGGPDTNICEFNVAYFYTNNWLNYTRTYPAGTFNVWGRLAAGGGAFTNCTLSLVTSGVGTSNQTTQVLGSFSDPAPAGWQTYHWIELSDANNNPVYAQLSGQETLRLTAPTNSTPAGNGLNPLFFMLVPASPPFSISASVSGNTVSIHFPTQSGHNYTVLYSTSLGSPSWQTLSTGIAGDGTVHTVNDSASGGSQRFYRVQAQ
jgi:hypothetical protein